MKNKSIIILICAIALCGCTSKEEQEKYNIELINSKGYDTLQTINRYRFGGTYIARDKDNGKKYLIKIVTRDIVSIEPLEYSK